MNAQQAFEKELKCMTIDVLKARLFADDLKNVHVNGTTIDFEFNDGSFISLKVVEFEVSMRNLKMLEKSRALENSSHSY